MALPSNQKSDYEADPLLIESIITQESAGDPQAVGPDTRYGNAMGLMQIIPSTWEEWADPEDDPKNYEDNKKVGTKYYNHLLNKYDGDDKLALAAYNYGMGNVDRHLSQSEEKSFDAISDRLPSETQNYVPNILKRYEKNKGASEGALENPSLVSPDASSSYAALPPKTSVFTISDDAPQKRGIGTQIDFADQALGVLTSEDFDEIPFPEKVSRVATLYNSGSWDEGTYDTLKELSTQLLDGAPVEDYPNFQDIVGVPPRVESGEDAEQVLNEWKDQAVQRLFQEGVSPAFFGNQLDDYLERVSDDERRAYTARNRSALSWTANRAGNFTRDLIKGGVSAFAKPVAGVTRLAAPESEISNQIEALPELLGTPDNDYMYETTEDGYLELNEDGTPKLTIQTQLGQMGGMIGGLLAGGVGARLLGAGAKTLAGGFFGVNTLTMANDTFRHVEEQTGDIEKAYKATLAVPPAAAVATVGDVLVAGKVLRPALKGLSWFNISKFAAKAFSRDASIGGSTNFLSDAVQQAGEMSQTGESFDPQRAAIVGGAGTLAAGAIGTASAAIEAPIAFRQREIARADQVQRAVTETQNFQNRVGNEGRVNLPPEDFPPDVLSELGMQASPHPEGGTLLTRNTDTGVIEGTADELPRLLSGAKNLLTPDELGRVSRERALLLEKQRLGTLTESEGMRISELDTVLEATSNPNHINNIKSFETGIHKALQEDPSAAPYRWDEHRSLWEHTESGETAPFLKDLMSRQSGEGPAYILDVSDTSSVRILDEESLPSKPILEALEAESAELGKTIEDVEGRLLTQREDLSKLEAQRKEVVNTNKKSETYNRNLEAKKARATKNITDLQERKKLLEARKESIRRKMESRKKETPEEFTRQSKTVDLRLKVLNRNIAKQERILESSAGREKKAKASERLADLRDRKEIAESQRESVRKKIESRKTETPEQFVQRLENVDTQLRRVDRNISKQEELIQRSPKDITPTEDLDTRAKNIETLNKDYEKFLEERLARSRELNSEKKIAAKELEKDYKSIEKVKGKGHGALISSEGKQSIVIPKGLAPDVKEEVLAHELSHAITDKIPIPKDIEYSIARDLSALQTKGSIGTASEVAEDVLLPGIRSVTQIPEGVSVKNLQKQSREALLSRREYLANQIAAEMLRRAGREVPGIKVNPELQAFLKEVNLPKLPERAPVASSDGPPVVPDISKSGTGDGPPLTSEGEGGVGGGLPPSEGSGIPPGKADDGSLFSTRSGERKETRFSKRVSKEAPGVEPVTYEAISNVQGSRGAAEYINRHGVEATTKLLTDTSSKSDGIPGEQRSYLANALLEKADAEYRANPTRENWEKSFAAFQVRASIATGAGQTLGALSNTLNADTFTGFITSLRQQLRLGDPKSTDFTDFALKKLEAIWEAYKKAPEGQVKNDLKGEAQKIALQDQKINWWDWSRSYIRGNYISGVGTFNINILGGAFMAPVFTALRHPTLALVSAKSLFESVPLAFSDAKRVLRGREATLFFDKLADPTPLYIADNANIATAAASLYNRFGKQVLRFLKAGDSFNRRLASNMYASQESVKRLKRLYGKDPERYTLEASKLITSPEKKAFALNQAEQEYKTSGLPYNKDDVAVRAYEIMASGDIDPNILMKASDWTDIVSLRGTLGHVPYRALNDSLQGITKRYPKLGTATVLALPFGRALFGLLDFTTDFVPGTVFAKKLSQPGVFPEGSPEWSKQQTHIERSVAGQKVAGTIGSVLLAGALADWIEITGEETQVLDRTPGDDKDQVGRAAKGRRHFEEFKQTGESPHTIRFKGTDIGFVYRDVPGLNVIVAGVKSVKESIDEGRDPFDAAVRFYSSSLNHMFAATSLSAPYKKIWDSIFDTDGDAAEQRSRLGKAFDQFARQTSGAFIPASSLLRDVKKAYDDTPESTVQDTVSYIFRDIPGASEIFGSLPALDVYGEEQKRSISERIPGLSRVAGIKKAPDSSLEMEQQRQGLIMPADDKIVKFTKGQFPNETSREKLTLSREDRLGKAYVNAFTPQEWYDYVKATGPQLKRVMIEELASDDPTDVKQQRIIRRAKQVRDTYKKNYIRSGKF